MTAFRLNIYLIVDFSIFAFAPQVNSFEPNRSVSDKLISVWAKILLKAWVICGMLWKRS